jgi:methionine biosynthesis protein MetW
MKLRKDLALVATLIPPASRVLDLGCDDGQLLSHLMANSDCLGTGVEIDSEAVLAAIANGVPVVELNLDDDLGDFADKSFDIVVLSRTIQALRRPEKVLRQMSRIGSRLIVSAPNFGWWGNRLRLLLGRMPISKDLPYEWYNSPNIRFTTLVDLEALFETVGLRIDERITLSPKGDPLGRTAGRANLFAGAAVYILTPKAA